MKKFILSLFLLFMCQAAALAATIKVQSQSDFTTENPPETLTVKAVTDLILDNGFIIINEGYTLKGDIVDVSSPKRLKRDASFAFILKEYTDNNGQTHTVDSLVKGKFTTKFDYKSVAKSAALGVGSYFVKGLSSAYATVEGAVKTALLAGFRVADHAGGAHFRPGGRQRQMQFHFMKAPQFHMLKKVKILS